MADENKVLVQIELSLDNHGERETVESLKRMGAKVTEAGQESGKALEVPRREAFILARAMGHDVPGGADVMKAAMVGASEPMLGAVFLIIAAVDLLREHFGEAAKEQAEAQKADADRYKEISKLADERDEGLQKIGRTARKIAQDEIDFYKAIARAGDDAIERQAKLDEIMLKGHQSAGSSRSSALKAAAEKEIDDLEKHGLIAHAQALAAKEQMDIAFHQKEMARMIAQNTVEEQLLQQQIVDRKNIVEDKKEDQNDETDSLKKLNDAKKKAADDESKAKFAALHAQEQIDRLTKQGAPTTSGVMGWELAHPGQTFHSDFQARLSKATGDLRKAEADQKNAKASQDKIDEQIEDTDKALNETQESIKKNAETANQLAEKLEQLASQHGLEEKQAQMNSAIEQAATQLVGHSANLKDFMGKLATTAAKIVASQPVSKAEIDKQFADIWTVLDRTAR